MGLAVGVEKLAGAGLLAGGSRAKDSDTWEPKGRYGAVAPVDGRIGTETMPGVFAQIGMEYGHRYGGTSFELFARISEKNHAHSTLNPLAAYTKKMSLEQIMGDVMIAYPNTRPMCSANCDGAAAAVVVSDAKLQARCRSSSSAGRSRCRPRCSPPTPGRRPARCCPTSTRSPATPPPRPTSRPASAPEDLDLVELHDCFATAELVHYDNLMLCEQGGAVDFFESGATWRDGSTPVNVSGGLRVQGPPHRRHRHRQHLGGLPPPPGRGRRPPDRGRQGRPGPRHRPRLGLRRPHPGEGRRLTLVPTPAGVAPAGRYGAHRDSARCQDSTGPRRRRGGDGPPWRHVRQAGVDRRRPHRRRRRVPGVAGGRGARLRERRCWRATA